MNLRLILVGLIALAAAGAAAYIVVGVINAKPAQVAVAPAPPKPAPQIEVLVSARAIRPGTLLQQADMTWQPWPAGGVSPGFVVKDPEKQVDLIGHVSRTAIAPGLPIIPDTLVKPGDRGFLAAVLKPGMRAISIPVDATTGVSGFVFPGDHVDIILTFSTGGQGNDNLASQTVLDDLRVIATDQKTVQQNGQVTVYKTATVEVTTEQAEKIALALQLGRLSLSLRAIAREEEEGETPAAGAASANRPTSYTLARDVSPLLGARSPAAPTKPRRVTTVMRGGEVQEIQF